MHLPRKITLFYWWKVLLIIGFSVKRVYLRGYCRCHNFGECALVFINRSVMKKLVVILIIFTCLPAWISAQGRLQESSSSKVPVWVKREVPASEATKVLGSSKVNLEIARESAITQMQTIALEKTTTYLLRQDIAFEQAENSQKGRNQVEKMVRESDYMQLILDSDALEYYWEVRYDKKTKTTYYLYYMLFPFNEFEMKKIALECDFDRSSARKARQQL